MDIIYNNAIVGSINMNVLIEYSELIKLAKKNKNVMNGIMETKINVNDICFEAPLYKQPPYDYNTEEGNDKGRVLFDLLDWKNILNIINNQKYFLKMCWHREGKMLELDFKCIINDTIKCTAIIANYFKMNQLHKTLLNILKYTFTHKLSLNESEDKDLNWDDCDENEFIIPKKSDDCIIIRIHADNEVNENDNKTEELDEKSDGESDGELDDIEWDEELDEELDKDKTLGKRVVCYIKALFYPSGGKNDCDYNGLVLQEYCYIPCKTAYKFDRIINWKIYYKNEIEYLFGNMLTQKSLCNLRDDRSYIQNELFPEEYEYSYKYHSLHFEEFRIVNDKVLIKMLEECNMFGYENNLFGKMEEIINYWY